MSSLSPEARPETIGHRRARARRLARLVAVAAIAVTSGLSGCKSSDADTGATDERAVETAEEERPARAVRVAETTRGPFARHAEFTGEVLADRIVDVASLEPGRLDQIAVDRGDRVEQGQEIARLDEQLQQDQLRAAQHAVDTASARVAQARAERARLEREIARLESLVARDARPRIELDQAIDQRAVLDASIALGEAQLEEARAAVRSARTALARRRVVAPFAGLVTRRLVSPGAVVTPQSSLVTLVDESSLRVVARFPEGRLPLLEPGARAEVRVDALPGRVLDATVVRVGQEIDRTARTVEAELAFVDDAATTDVAHGMFVRGWLEVERLDDAVQLPVDALDEVEEGHVRVWVVSDDIADAVQVEVLGRSGRTVAVEGIDAGVRIVTSPPRGFRDGQPVIVVGDAEGSLDDDDAEAEGSRADRGSGEGAGEAQP